MTCLFPATTLWPEWVVISAQTQKGIGIFTTSGSLVLKVTLSELVCGSTPEKRSVVQAEGIFMFCSTT